MLAGGDLVKRNIWGEILTDGARAVDWALNKSEARNWITKSGMAYEGSGQHFYDENSFLGRFVNRVSKVHDAMNSWSYSEDGLYMSRGVNFDTGFQLYSFAGMLPAAGVTAVVFASENEAVQTYAFKRGLK